MCGEFIKEKCSKCGITIDCHYGITSVYKDLDGEFYYDGIEKCKTCGHLINSERVEKAQFLHVVCL